MRIVLIGYMGSGKSTIGKKLADCLKLPYKDLDSSIEAAEQAEIASIFKDKGEIYFRRTEQLHLKELLKGEDQLVLSTGGGTPCYSGNMETMLEGSQAVIYLKLSIPKLVERLHAEKAQRPLIAHLDDKELPEFIGKHLFERNTFYNMAHHTILCDDKTPAEIVDEINTLLV